MQMNMVHDVMRMMTEHFGSCLMKMSDNMAYGQQNGVAQSDAIAMKLSDHTNAINQRVDGLVPKLNALTAILETLVIEVLQLKPTAKWEPVIPVDVNITPVSRSSAAAAADHYTEPSVKRARSEPEVKVQPSSTPPIYDVDDLADQQSLPHNTLVKLKGLTSKPELNGKSGIIEEYDPVNKRYAVTIFVKNPKGRASLQQISFRHENLTKIEGHFDSFTRDMREDYIVSF